MDTTIWTWTSFNAFLLGILALAIGVFRRRAHEVTVRSLIIAGRSARRPAGRDAGVRPLRKAPR